MDKNIYTNFEAIDFAQDPGFIRYVKSSDTADIDFWEEWIAAHPDKSDEVEIARQMIDSIQVKEPAIESEQVEQLWGKIHHEISQEAPVRQLAPRKLAVRRWLSVAAAACIGLLLFFYFYNPNTIVNAPMGDHLAYTLPDGSALNANADSKLVFNEKKWSENREINLKGEAFFKVEKGSRFTVKTPYGTVEVLGTSFNVYAREDGFAVNCFTGKVKVTTKDGHEQILTPGLGTALEEEQTLSQPANFDATETATWRQGDFYYEGSRLGTVFAELERQFDIQIKTTDEIRQKVGTIYFDNQNLDSALYKVTWPMGLEVEKQGRIIEIR